MRSTTKNTFIGLFWQFLAENMGHLAVKAISIPPKPPSILPTRPHGMSDYVPEGSSFNVVTCT